MSESTSIESEPDPVLEDQITIPVVKGGGLYVVWFSDVHYYGGRAVLFKTRWKDHLKALREGTHENSRMQAVFNKYRRFHPTVVEGIPEASARKEAEQKWLDEHFRKPGCLNLNDSSDGGCAFRSEETRRKMSATRTSRPDLVEAARKAIEKNRLPLGTPRPESWIRNQADSQRGRKQPPELVEKRAASHRGRKNTPETLARMSESAKRRALLQPTSHGMETRALISRQQKGRVWINDGTRNSRAFLDSVPEGWVIGRLPNRR